MDRYARVARLYPALLVATPATVLTFALLPTMSAWGERFLGLSVIAGVPFAITQVVRDSGRRIEKELFAGWGGPPTRMSLELHDRTDDVSLRRRALVERATGLRLPTASDERDDPDGSNRRYDAAVSVLRERTRAGQRFDLLSQELANYGFRRNSLTLRKVGIAAATFSLVVGLSALMLGLSHRVDIPLPLAGAAILVACASLVFWIGVVTTAWVKSAADIYCDRLFGALEMVVISGEG